MRISIASDHAGFDQKEELVAYLKEQGMEVSDRGPENAERVDYPDFAKLVAKDVADGKADFGILICGTGIGMAISANKISGIRAANVTNVDLARLARGHNDANVLTLSARFVSVPENEEIIDAFLSEPFSGGRHAGRVEKIMELENLSK